MAYQIKLEMFEGPFDLLFHLIDKNEVDIYDIPIAEITDQYLDYVAQMQLLDLEVTSEFLVLAATLLSIKSRMLLPKPPKPEDDEEAGLDPRDELVERLLEYRKFKQVAEYLQDRERVHGRVYTRENDTDLLAELFSEEDPLAGVNLGDLLTALREVLIRVEVETVPPELPREEYNIRDKMREIARRLIFYPNGLAFSQLFVGKNLNRVEVVVTFLALLELIKQKKATVHQSRLFAEITVFSRRETAEGE